MRRRKAIASVWFVAAFAAFASSLFSRPLLAVTGEQAPPSPPTTTTGWNPVGTVHVQLPFAGALLWRKTDGAWPLFAASLSERIRDLFEAEIGGTFFLNPCVSGWLGHVRAGVSLSVVGDERAQGWNIRLPLLAGYRGGVLSGDGCDGFSRHTLHLLTANAGLEAAYWTSGRWAFDVRVLGGVGGGLNQAQSRVRQPEDVDFNRVSTWDVGLSLGVAWR